MAKRTRLGSVSGQHGPSVDFLQSIPADLANAPAESSGFPVAEHYPAPARLQAHLLGTRGEILEMAGKRLSSTWGKRSPELFICC